MENLNLNPCPFCGEQVPATYPTLSEYDEGSWNVTHMCAGIRRSKGRTGVAIDVYGVTKEEVIENWNKRAAMKPIAVEGYIYFHGVVLVKACAVDMPPAQVFGDWLYKPDTDCWYCGGHSYPASICRLPE